MSRESRSVRHEGVVLVQGPPGTGKTTTLIGLTSAPHLRPGQPEGVPRRFAAHRIGLINVLHNGATQDYYEALLSASRRLAASTPPPPLRAAAAAATAASTASPRQLRASRRAARRPPRRCLCRLCRAAAAFSSARTRTAPSTSWSAASSGSSLRSSTSTAGSTPPPWCGSARAARSRRAASTCWWSSARRRSRGLSPGAGCSRVESERVPPPARLGAPRGFCPGRRRPASAGEVARAQGARETRGRVRRRASPPRGPRPRPLA